MLGREFEYIQAAIDSMHLAGGGQFTRKCNELLENALGALRVHLTTSCTHALEMAAVLLDIKAGDEVIVPSYTFVSTASAFALRGAKPVFADVRRDTLNLDENKLEELITPRTRAIVPVHYAGVGCEMDAIGTIASRHRISVIEDNAHGLFGRYRGRHLGTFGQLAAQSFHETKNFTCGEGGALVVNDPTLTDRAEIVRDKGTNRSRFFRGQVDKYTWVDHGSSYLPSEILAAFLYAQLERRHVVQERRRYIYEYYLANLADWAAAHEVQLPFVPSHCEQAYHMFYFIMPSLSIRQRMLSHLRANDVNAVFHYVPLHLSDMGQRFGGKPGMCPVAENMSDRLVRLPCFNTITDEELDRTVEAVRKFGFR